MPRCQTLAVGSKQGALSGRRRPLQQVVAKQRGGRAEPLGPPRHVPPVANREALHVQFHQAPAAQGLLGGIPRNQGDAEPRERGVHPPNIASALAFYKI